MNPDNYYQGVNNNNNSNFQKFASPSMNNQPPSHLNLMNLNYRSFIYPKLKNSSSSTTKMNKNSNQDKIIEVYEDNFIQEIKRIGSYLKKYPYIGMDTEYPGIVYPCTVNTPDYYYKFIKVNVDKLKLIQLGISLSNDKGEFPPNACTWQFNLRFDCDKDEHSNESMSMLFNSGIDFNKLKANGIPHTLFAEYFMVSGLVLNEDITWISFNGFSDFAYLLKILLGDSLPEEENIFTDVINEYFPNLYDIKYLINENEMFKGGLNKLAKDLGVERIGEIHQAGSDSMVTSEVFFRLIKNKSIGDSDLAKGKNVLFGIGEGTDNNETIGYTKFAAGLDITYLLQSINNGISMKNQNMNGLNNYDFYGNQFY